MAKKKAEKKSASDKTARGGRVCGMMDHHHYLAETDPTYRSNCREIERFSAAARLRAAPARSTVLRIPVVVHVLHNTDAENLSLSQIESQIDALNRDYRARNVDRADIPDAFKGLAVDTLIEFALAVRDPQGNATTGITRTRTSLAQFPYDPDDRAATAKLDNLIKHNEFGRAPWPRDSYLNMWACTIQGGLLGYASFPGGAASTDGVVINNTAFGSGGTARAPFDQGRTAVHEVGHWLNLLHIWGDDSFPGSPNTCAGSDNVGDTPNQSGSNGGPGVTKNSFPLVSCNNGPNGDMFMNYMDYVDDKVMVMFSKGQLDRMNDALSGPRASLEDSQGLTPVVTERISLTGASERSIAESIGNQTKLVFDGVGWVPSD